MMMYRSDSLPFAGVETGTVGGYKDNELISANLFKSKMPISYANLCIKKHKDAPILFTLSTEAEILTMGIERTEDAFDIIHTLGTHLTILYIKQDFPLKIKFGKPIAFTPSWG